MNQIRIAFHQSASEELRKIIMFDEMKAKLNELLKENDMKIKDITIDLKVERYEPE